MKIQLSATLVSSYSILFVHFCIPADIERQTQTKQEKKKQKIKKNSKICNLSAFTFSGILSIALYSIVGDQPQQRTVCVIQYFERRICCVGVDLEPTSLHHFSCRMSTYTVWSDVILSTNIDFGCTNPWMMTTDMIHMCMFVIAI